MTTISLVNRLIGYGWGKGKTDGLLYNQDDVLALCSKSVKLPDGRTVGDLISAGRKTSLVSLPNSKLIRYKNVYVASNKIRALLNSVGVPFKPRTISLVFNSATDPVVCKINRRFFLIAPVIVDGGDADA